MKAIIRYPYVVLNTIEVDLSGKTDDEIYRLENDMAARVELINDTVPGYESTDMSLCRGAAITDAFQFRIED